MPYYEDGIEAPSTALTALAAAVATMSKENSGVLGCGGVR